MRKTLRATLVGGAMIQGITTAVKDVINGLTHPFAPKSGAGSSGSQSTSGSQAAA
jgi:hypothetical protein